MEIFVSIIILLAVLYFAGSKIGFKKHMNKLISKFFKWIFSPLIKAPGKIGKAGWGSAKYSTDIILRKIGFKKDNNNQQGL